MLEIIKVHNEVQEEEVNLIKKTMRDRNGSNINI